jgi:TonB family protein
MYSKKVILWPVIISIVGHVALISASSMIDLRDDIQAAEIFTVNISEPETKQARKKEEKKKNEKRPQQGKEIKPVNSDGWREDTVGLSSGDIRYAFYLNKIKKKILQIWKYPQKAYDKNEEGVVVVRMTIDASGILSQTNLMSSSGSLLLDEDAIDVVRGAAPFEPLPASYSLSRLHIVASFNYRLVE